MPIPVDIPAIPGTTSVAIARSALAVVVVLFEADGPPMVEDADESFTLGAAGSVGFLRYAGNVPLAAARSHVLQHLGFLSSRIRLMQYER